MPSLKAAAVVRPRSVGELLIRRFDGADVTADPGRWGRPYERLRACAPGLADHSDPPLSDRLSRHAGHPGFSLAAP